MGSYDELYDSLKNDPDALQREIASVVRVSDDDVLTSMLRQAQTFMEWAYLQVRAEMDAKKARLYLEEEMEPECRDRAEASLKEEGTRATKDRMQDIVVRMADYKTAQQHYLVAQERALVLKRVVDALFQKKDMLQSLNSRQRVELDALPHDRTPPSSWSPGLPDGPVSDPRDDAPDEERVLAEAELGARIEKGRASFRTKRKEGLIRKLGREALRTKTENSDE